MSLKTISPLMVMDPMKGPFKIKTIEDNTKPDEDDTKLDEDDTKPDEDDYAQGLHRHSILHRLVLSRSLPRCLSLDRWHKIHLEVKNELGLSLKGERSASCCIPLTCELYVLDTDRGGIVCAPSSVELSFRPLQVDGWDESSALTMTTMGDEPGFHHSGQGGIEIKVSLASQQDARCMTQYTTKAKYLIRIAPKSDTYQTVDVFPLTVGFLEFKKHRPHQQLQQQNSMHCDHHQHQRINGYLVRSVAPTTNAVNWNMGGNANELSIRTAYRLYSLGSLLPLGTGSMTKKGALLDRYFVIKEVWEHGTQGKMWDSALVLSDMFAKKIMQEPTCLEGKHVVDLSTGTGCIGLLLGTLLRRVRPDHTCGFTLTDRAEALELIKENQRLNDGYNDHDRRISTKILNWGNIHDAKQLKKHIGGSPDVILASDVLYDPGCFTMLVDTLKYLCIPGKTVIYLGYKRRGLKPEEEDLFFNLANDYFDISTVGSSSNDQQPVGWEKEHGFMKRNFLSMDGRGWLGPTGTGSNIFDEARQEGKVIIYRLVKMAT